ncbi:fatty-acid amide hydrolase 2-B-like [Copidosoma floridanum]|uniref:fatty-acid amide hydrolase 2-B-like n=1 Tax=Copidosoma floridanum TaxID=29053 RepID=UPI0006C98D28|nr:fatty-acid amide hydrolase 2-B-like [Copidosoma floridanum]XP_014213645.1 fatty-acid amide hydrolase 2-B-like [Copidosoma floridanum]XP_014213646.1 fatty-acid amide hydrolase 2-B-like [Copidosoma floridanum]XP_014213647.1 fatty-acid amide hydrolase 2-B-like [Copidosoma floridanum]
MTMTNASINWPVRFCMWLVPLLAKLFFVMRNLIFIGLPKKQPPVKNVTVMDSASTLASKIRNRQLTSESTVRAFIARIEEVQPILNCVTEKRFEKALEEALECDRQLRSPNAPTADFLAAKKPLFGVPFSVKECIAVEEMKQTAGLVCRRNVRADEDAECVRLMRQAGGIPIATTNLSELAMWMESYNCVYGITKNPHNTWHTSGGSSGGEGSLLAAGGSPCGLGSDIGGSIRIPSFFNGIFGHKPSMGVVSREGHYPEVSTPEQDEMCVVGPLSRHAEDLTLLLRVIAGKNADRLKLHSSIDPSKLKIYFMEEEENCPVVTPVEPEIKAAMQRAVRHLERAYGVKATRVNISAFKDALPIWFAWMAVPPGKDMSVELTDGKYSLGIGRELVKLLFGLSEHTFVALVTAGFEKFTATRLANDGESKKKCYKLQGAMLRQVFEKMLGQNGVFIYPTHPTAAPMHFEPLVRPFNWIYTGIINVLGLPSTACPLGFNKNGLPIGIQIVSGLYQDRLSLAIAEELERAFTGCIPAPTVKK